MSTGQHSDSASEQHSDSEHDSQLSNISSIKDVTKMLIGKMNKFDFCRRFLQILIVQGLGGKTGNRPGGPNQSRNSRQAKDILLDL